MLSIPGTETLPSVIKFGIAFGIFFILFSLFVLVYRRISSRRLYLQGNDRGRTRQPRLGIVDVYDLDRQRQLILLRRDNVEHLLLIGGPNDVIVETNIVRTAGARLPSPAAEQGFERPDAMIERALEAPARPMIEPVQRPEPARPEPVPRPEPVLRPEPAVRPEHVRAEPVIAARLGATDARLAATPLSRQEPAPLPPEPILKPDVVALAPIPEPEPPLPQPLREAPRPAPARPAPPPPRPAATRPPPPREPPAPPPPEVRPPPRPAPEPPPRQAPTPPPAAAKPRDATIADAAVLSDMAKQLEEALKRPLPATRSGAAPNGPAPAPDERPARPSAAPPPREPAPAFSPPPPPPPAAPAAPLRPTAAPSELPRPVPVSRMRPTPEPEPASAPKAEAPVPERSRPAAPAATPAAAPEQVDPFSVEEIEAEFARLLGRPLDRGERPH